MATTSIIPTLEFTKQSFLQSSCVSVSKTKEQKQIVIPPKIIPKQEVEVTHKQKYSLNESESVKQVRIRSLSHWSHIIPNSTSMASAGWFSCNVNDRVICIYCNTICHQWTINDDPTEVHARLAPQCPFVLSMTSIEQPVKVINDIFSERFDPIHPLMAEISRREATFAKITWPENSHQVLKI